MATNASEISGERRSPIRASLYGTPRELIGVVVDEK
jgi:hypothetical protein